MVDSKRAIYTAIIGGSFEFLFEFYLGIERKSAGVIPIA